MSELSLYEKIPTLENNFSIKLRSYELNSAIVAHWHEHIELVFILDGECELYVGGQIVPAKKDDLLIINSAEVHSFENKHRMRFYSMLLYPEFFSDVKLPHGEFRPVIEQDGYVKELFGKMYAEHQSGRVTSDMMIKSHAYSLISYLTENYFVPTARRRAIKTSPELLGRLKSVIEYISESYGEKITTSTLATMCYMNESHFCRFFKSTVGKTPIEYINGFKIEKACVMLCNTDESISQIAAAVGYDDINYFSRVFKTHKGMTPREYRRSLCHT